MDSRRAFTGLPEQFFRERVSEEYGREKEKPEQLCSGSSRIRLPGSERPETNVNGDSLNVVTQTERWGDQPS